MAAVCENNLRRDMIMMKRGLPLIHFWRGSLYSSWNPWSPTLFSTPLVARVCMLRRTSSNRPPCRFLLLDTLALPCLAPLSMDDFGPSHVSKRTLTRLSPLLLASAHIFCVCWASIFMLMTPSHLLECWWCIRPTRLLRFIALVVAVAVVVYMLI